MSIVPFKRQVNTPGNVLMNTYVYCKDGDYAQFKPVQDHTPLKKYFYSSKIESQANIQRSDEHNTITIRLQFLRGCYSAFAHEESHYFGIHNEFVIFFHSLLFISSVYYRSFYDQFFPLLSVAGLPGGRNPLGQRLVSRIGADAFPNNLERINA
jgi:hypothetical protein